MQQNFTLLEDIVVVTQNKNTQLFQYIIRRQNTPIYQDNNKHFIIPITHE